MEEEVREIAEIKKELENKVAQLEKELNMLRNCLKVIDGVLAKSSFKPAIELVSQAPAPATPTTSTTTKREDEQEFQVKSKLGEPLATMYVGKGYVRIVPAQDKKFSVRVPPFTSFFIDRVLGEMKRRDEEKAQRGERYIEEVLKFDVKTEDGDAISEIFIDNVFEDDRIREIRSAARWTFERMYEKIKRGAH